MDSSRADNRAGRHHLAALAPMMLLALAACGDSTTPRTVQDATAGPAGVSASGDATGPSPSAGPTSNATPTGDGSGCPRNQATVPEGSTPVEVGDLDGDGARDQLWLARDGDERMLGVRTASGRTFSRTFTSRNPKPAAAVANRLGDGSAVILLDTGDYAALYAVVDCRIEPTANVANEQYEFDLGYSIYGTGVACPMAKGELFLAGYNLTGSGREGYKNIVRTRIDLSRNGTEAHNGTVAELGAYAEDSPSYRIAEGVSCGDSGTAQEPAG